MSASAMERSCTGGQDIPIRRLVIHNEDDMPDVYSSTPGGTIFGTTPGGTKIIYERAFLMEMRNSPMARTPPKNLPKIPGVTGVTVDLDKRPSPTKGTKEASEPKKDDRKNLPEQSQKRSRMSPKIFDWHKLHAEIADETFGIPPDVVFQIVEDGLGELHEVKAHKMILAMVSLPFKTMFYTTEVGDRTSKPIKIEQTTAPAFQIMIDAIYEMKSIEESLKGKSVQEVFDVVHLIEQYQIAELAEAMEKYLADYPVTDDSVLEVAVEAAQYTTLFQKEAKHLLLTCAKFLKPKLKDAESIFKYASKTDQKEVFSILLALMDEIPPTECPNCGYENCQDRKPIKLVFFERRRVQDRTYCNQ